MDRRTDGKEEVIDPVVAVSVPHSTHSRSRPFHSHKPVHLSGRE
jgi:hypothetical protein